MPLSRRQLLVCASASAWAPALRAASPPLVDWLRSPAFVEPLRERLQKAQVPGLALVAMDGGAVVHSAGHGWADLTARRAMSADTLLNVASVTKVFTCTALMQFHEQGRLDLDAPADTWLPRHAMLCTSPCESLSLWMTSRPVAVIRATTTRPFLCPTANNSR